MRFIVCRSLTGERLGAINASPPLESFAADFRQPVSSPLPDASRYRSRPRSAGPDCKRRARRHRTPRARSLLAQWPLPPSDDRAVSTGSLGSSALADRGHPHTLVPRRTGDRASDTPEAPASLIPRNWPSFELHRHRKVLRLCKGRLRGEPALAAFLLSRVQPTFWRTGRPARTTARLGGAPARERFRPAARPPGRARAVCVTDPRFGRGRRRLRDAPSPASRRTAPGCNRALPCTGLLSDSPGQLRRRADAGVRGSFACVPGGGSSAALDTERRRGARAPGCARGADRCCRT
jgi:hypothetical protein